MIAILDSGAANVRSVENALKRLSVEYIISDDISELSQADKIIFPGVGHATEIMKNLRTKNLINFIKSWTNPFLGICLGMQVLFDSSAEGETECLGIIPGQVEKFSSDLGVKVPQIGWNKIQIDNNDLATNDFFYFVHSYFVPVNSFTTATSEYGQDFSAMVQKDNFYGVQFHPEKSGATGEQLLKKFCEL